MRSKSIHIIFFLTLSALTCQAQVGFDNDAIYQLYKKLPTPIQTEVDMGVTENKNIVSNNSEIFWEGKLLTYSHNKNIISHIGMSLHNITVTGDFQSEIIRFLERALLRLSFENSFQDMVSCAEIMQLKILYANQNLIFSTIRDFGELFQAIQTAGQFNLVVHNNLILAEWIKNPGESLQIIFPGSPQLIKGKNKKELDQEVILALFELSNKKPAEAPGFINSNLATVPITTVPGSDYYGQISSNTYYYINGSDSSLVFNSGNIPFSVSNLFLENKLSGRRNLKLEGKIYGGVSTGILISLKNYNSFFTTDYDVFCGLEKTNPGSIEGTVIYRHKYYSFIHLMHFKTNSEEIFSDSGEINATFYPNIPMHNVSNLFSDNSADKNQPIITIKIK